jgi:hypothetical protein
MYRATLVAACACLALAADSARASDPVAIYARCPSAKTSNSYGEIWGVARRGMTSGETG